ncbi:hypothetical protein BVC80_521g48 [Macleaya cordata]|uniref:Uncharacterized protein n=1 Tax=Macleaya cordata TaxID=56857 RepID=A0A200R974_MACCD|nr:hypothetical protein BVC80_521g48 [Macleaya cordata]
MLLSLTDHWTTTDEISDSVMSATEISGCIQICVKTMALSHLRPIFHSQPSHSEPPFDPWTVIVQTVVCRLTMKLSAFGKMIREGIRLKFTLPKQILGVSGDAFTAPIDKELVRSMPLPSVPDEYWESRRFQYFGECRGHLQLIDTYGPSPTCFDIMELETD